MCASVAVNANDLRGKPMAMHLTPTELAQEAGLERRQVISKCMELGVPIFQGRIDKSLFMESMRAETDPVTEAQPSSV
jgi:hypothetical protein